jgi:hypothetical protein
VQIFRILSKEKATAKSLAPEITSVRALNSSSSQSMKSGISMLSGRGAERTPYSFKDYWYSA